MSTLNEASRVLHFEREFQIFNDHTVEIASSVWPRTINLFEGETTKIMSIHKKTLLSFTDVLSYIVYKYSS